MDNYEGAIEVSIWGETLGWLDYDVEKHVSFFQLNNECKWHDDVAPLLMTSKINPDLEFGPFRNPRGEDWFQGIPPMIADSLPDDFGNTVLLEYLQKIGKSRADMNIPMRLAYTGSRGMGALEFRPALIKQQKNQELNLSRLASLSNQIIESHLPQDIDDDVLHNLFMVGTSAGGARSKAVVSINRTTNKLVVGDKSNEGFTPVIIKFDKLIRGTQDPSQSGIIEHIYNVMARSAGIEMNDSWLIENEGYSHFCTTRFDRDPVQGKLHMQTYAALTGKSPIDPHRSEGIYETMVKLGAQNNHLKQEFRRMCFSYMMCNRDRHTKNISFLMNKTGSWVSSPEYDVTFPFEMNRPWVRPHAMSINGKVKDIELNDLLVVAKNIGIKAAKGIVNEIADIVDTFKEVAQNHGLRDDFIESVQKNLTPVRSA